jgi:hypothetical protein
MSVEIGTEAAQFPEKKYINGIFVAVWIVHIQYTEGRESGRLVFYRWETVLPARSFSALLLKTVGHHWESRRTSESIE